MQRIDEIFNHSEIQALKQDLLEKYPESNIAMLDVDNLYIPEIEDGLYKSNRLNEFLCVVNGYVLTENFSFISTRMLSLYPINATAWGFASTFYRILGKDKPKLFLASDSNSIIKELELRKIDDLSFYQKQRCQHLVKCLAMPN